MSAPAPSKLNHEQILQGAYDEAEGQLRVAAEVTANIAAAQEVVISHVDDSIRIGDGARLAHVTTVDGINGLDVNVLNQLDIVPQGLSTGIKTQKILVTDVPTKIPTTPLAGRNSMSVRVWNLADTTVIVYFGESTVNTDSYPKGHGEEVILDVKDNAAVGLWAVCETGRQAYVRVIELA